MFFRLTLDDNFSVAAVLDGFSALVDHGPVSGRGEEGRNSGAAGPDFFGQGSLKIGFFSSFSIKFELGGLVKRPTEGQILTDCWFHP